MLFRLREMLLDTIEAPMKEAFDELQRYKEKLQDFSDDADKLPAAWDQYSKFQVRFSTTICRDKKIFQNLRWFCEE